MHMNFFLVVLVELLRYFGAFVIYAAGVIALSKWSVLDRLDDRMGGVGVRVWLNWLGQGDV